MRFCFLLSLSLMAALMADAQAILPGSYSDYSRLQSFRRNHTDSVHHKWSVNKYAALSMSYSFFKGGNASIISAPVGLQVNRQLTDHVYAFAGASLAPSYVRMNGAFLPPAGDNKYNPAGLYNGQGRLALFSRAELGLMYVNDAKTFSISGSIGVEKSTSPLFYGGSFTNPNPVFIPNK